MRLRGSPKFIKVAVFIALLAFYASLLVQKIQLAAGDDLPRLIKNGETLFATTAVLNKNLYSYTEPDHPFANHHWLSGVIFYLLARTVGFSGIVIFKIIVLLSAFALLFVTALKKANFWLVAVLSLPTIILLSERVLARPEIFSYLFIAIFLYLLAAFERQPQRHYIFWLIPMQAMWVNLHLYFGIGPLIVAGFLLEKIVLHRRDIRGNPLIIKAVVLLVSVIAASFINPFGMAGAISSLKLNVTHDFPISITENQSVATWLKITSAWENPALAVFAPAVIVLYISFIPALQRMPIFYAAAGASSAVLAYSLVRALPLFGLIFLPAASANFQAAFERYRSWLPPAWKLSEKRARQAAGILFIAALALSIGLVIRGRQYDGWGVGLEARANNAAAFFRRESLSGPVFNDANIGSYLIYHLYPAERVFVDNRFGDAYSAAFFQDVYLPMLEHEAVWQEKAAQYGFNAIFFTHPGAGDSLRAFVSRRLRDPSWALVFGDGHALILLKNTPASQAQTQRLQITAANAADKLRYLTESGAAADQHAAADIFCLLGRTDLAVTAYTRAGRLDKAENLNCGADGGI